MREIALLKHSPSGAILLPAVPNTLLTTINDVDPLMPLLLRTNTTLQFTENKLFEPVRAIYDKNYDARQEHSCAFQEHVRKVLAMLSERFPLQTRIAEIGCGKGTFLAMLEQVGFSGTIGFDPTYDGAKQNIRKQKLTETDRLDSDLIIMRHSLEYIQRPHEFVRTLGRINSNVNSAIYIEAPCFEWVKRTQAFFSVTCEYVNYFTLPCLSRMFGNRMISSGYIFNGQYLYVIAHIRDLSEEYTTAYEDGPWSDEDFETLFPTLRSRIHEIAKDLGENRKLYIWGAGTKGCLFLYHALRIGFPIDHVPFVIDINPAKVGKLLPGSKTPVCSKEDFFARAKPSDVLAVANPAYLGEITREISSRGLAMIDIVVL